MIFFSRARTNILSWVHETPLPSSDQAYPKFQSWHHFDPVQQWIPTRSNNTNEPAKSTSEGDPSDLVLLTWNIDATSSRTQERVTEIVTFITGLDPKVHVVFLQEGPGSQANEMILHGEYTPARFALDSDSGMSNATLGPIWRVKYPSHFDRDALCCDIFAFSPREPEPSSTTRIRLVNVHLDSLPMNPSYRPRQISIISSLLYAAGRGLVAGDFNPVLKDDATLIEDSGLIDVWTSLHSEDPGYTWGVDGEQPFPPNRLDKVAVLGLSPYNIKTLKPKRLSNLDESESQQAGRTEEIPWSDHHALLCSFGLFAK
ncbi:Endonuclease/exonuclease/phosphatase [Penicillium cf. griseofulvum]|nr:Endonuclease/exonuclease/phosphatase [Penicillium cf. griseofulvum]